MKNLKNQTFKRILFVVFAAVLSCLQTVSAQNEVSLRRPISPDQPMWLIHIDTWNYADPQKIIDLIPDDIKPFVVMNISLSISHDVETSQFQVAEYGYEIAKSWVRTCAQNQMWAIVQLSSGGFAHFSDFDLSVYEEFYREYPNFLGFNYAEQFWGFDDPNDPLSASWSDRMSHLANLLELSNHYGGYLVVSMCWNQWGPSINPIGQLKRNPEFAEACSKYTENYILTEKYTQQAYQSDMESICLGAYLSGYSGNYGIRYDSSGWTDDSGEHNNFTMATAGAVHLEHIMLTGQTVVDGPELIWTQCFKETNRMPTTDGYTKRNWETFPQFDNVSVDLFRKIIDGTVRIPTREEVIERSKVVVINDIDSGSDDDVYSSPETLFQGLYRMDGDGNLKDNKTFFKKTGRYPTVPVVYNLDDSLANTFQLQVNKSDYSDRWPSIADKVNEFNSLFPSEYSGDIYAGRHENAWVTYNPYKTSKNASGNLQLKYNTCDSLGLSFSQYTAGVVTEKADSLLIYLSNYDNELNRGLKTDVIKVFGSSVEPTFTWQDRGDHQPSIVSNDWEGGVFTITIKHNGAIDVKISCEGDAVNRLSEYTRSSVKIPEKPSIYTGPRQYEAECFDYKNVNDVITAGQDNWVRNYTGQGYLRFGTSSSASVRDTVYALRSGLYALETRYSAAGGDVNTIDLYVNHKKIATPVFVSTGSESTWKINTQMVELQAGENVIQFTANKSGVRNIIFDNLVISQGSESNVYHFSGDEAGTSATNPPAELIAIKSGSAGVVSFTDFNGSTSNSLKAYSAGELNDIGVAGLEMFPHDAKNYSVVWKEMFSDSGAEKGILLRATGQNGSCPYGEGMKQGYLFTVFNNEDNTLTLKQYIADSVGISLKTTYTSTFNVNANEPYWLRAIALEDELTFECSADSINWEGGKTSTFTDGTYSSGASQVVWGFGTSNFEWVMDNITYNSSIVSMSKVTLSDLSYTQSFGPSDYQEIDVSGYALIDKLFVDVAGNFEISLHPDSTYSTSLVLEPIEGELPPTTIYVRLKPGLNVDKYSGGIEFKTSGAVTRFVDLNGNVSPKPTTYLYNFSDDVAANRATTPPSIHTSIGNGSSATAGVVSYTDAGGTESNVLTPYRGGQRNATGAVNLDLFSKTSTDYSVTWKQYLGSSDAGYKVGVLLRGDTARVGDASKGYVQGMMNGYVFIAYSSGSSTEFRIYRSTDNYNTLDMLILTHVNLDPDRGQPVWYRASVSGDSKVELKIEYSTDNINWNIGATATDNGAEVFLSGATQLVWGLGLGDVDFYVDDIIYKGFSEESKFLPERITTSTDNISELDYVFENGPSVSRQFTVWVDSLSEDVVINLTGGFEMALDTILGFNSSIRIPENYDFTDGITVFVRSKAGLPVGDYNGTLIISSEGALNSVVNLSGSVKTQTSINEITLGEAKVVSVEYYSITGRRIKNTAELNGFFIVRKQMSDGTVEVSKVHRTR